MLHVAKNDLEAYQDLVERHQGLVIGLAYRYLGDRSAAEDLAQDVFLSLYENRRKYQPTAKFTTFLYRITVNRCLNAVRDRRDHYSLIPEAAGAAPKAAGAEGAETRGRIMEEIGKLPEQQRMALILFQFDDLTYEEIAIVLKSSVSAVKSLIFRAREALREKLQDLL